tara:strand:+ start:769 stop:1188 length:420 start_codon:yes stop_codon:yes gene_type:complete
MWFYLNHQLILKNLLITKVTEKFKNSYKTISEVLKILNTDSPSIKKSQLHTIRFWETQFKQLKPKKINNRRYYDSKNINLLLKIQYLLKNQGMTISGVKKILDSNNLSIDLNEKKNISPMDIKLRINKINKLLKNLKEN